MTLEFELGLPDAPAPLDGPIELRWNRTTLRLMTTARATRSTAIEAD
ncbi:MAG: hypothetical protein WKF41_07050 [Gaiellaceae bacterium]